MQLPMYVHMHVQGSAMHALCMLKGYLKNGHSHICPCTNTYVRLYVCVVNDVLLYYCVYYMFVDCIYMHVYHCRHLQIWTILPGHMI